MHDYTASPPGNRIAKHDPVPFDAWVGARSDVRFGSNLDSANLPFQSWRNIKEAFAPDLVARAISDTPRAVRRVLDPFAGSGTTPLASQFLGVHPIAIELNPYLADFIAAKLTRYNPDHVTAAFSYVLRAVTSHRADPTAHFANAPSTFVEPGVNGRYIFPRAIAHRICSYLAAIDSLSSRPLRRLFRVLLGSTLIPASNVTVSGKGRRYRGRWRQRSKGEAFLDHLFIDIAIRAIRDISMYRERLCTDYTLLRGDARILCNQVDPVDLVVCSPPYPNSFDYTDVYNVELWALGYLRSRQDNTALRTATVRSHVQVHRDMSTTFVQPHALVTLLEDLRGRADRLWNPHLPSMIAAYFQDLHDVLRLLYQKVLPRGRIYLVVGDSQYAHVRVPVATILAALARMLGYVVVDAEDFRSLRVSPQQGGEHGLAETLLTLQRPT